MEEALRNLLLSIDGVAHLGREGLNWGVPPQGRPRPHVNLSLINGLPDMHFKGPSGWSEDRVQVDCWADRPGEATGLARAIEAGVSGLRTTFQEIRFRIFVVGRGGGVEDDGGKPIHRARRDLQVWWFDQGA